MISRPAWRDMSPKYFSLTRLTLSLPIPLRLYFYALPYWSNPPFLTFRALRRSILSAGVPEMLKIKNGGLDLYGAEPFEQQQFGTAGVEGLSSLKLVFSQHIRAPPPSLRDQCNKELSGC